MFQGEEYENGKACAGNCMQFSSVKAQSVRKEVLGEEVGEK